MSPYLRLLRNNPNYTRLWIAQAVSLLGDWFSTIALSTMVASFTGGSGAAVGLFLLARFLPALLIGPFAGVLVDRLNRKHLLIFSDCTRAFIVLLFLLVHQADQLWLLYLLSFAQFCLSALFEPARSAIIPSVVKDEDLVQANLLGSVTWSVMLAAGAAIGGIVAGSLGTGPALLIDASSFAISGALITSIKPRFAVRTSAQLGFRDGLRYVRGHPATAATLMIKMGGAVGSVDTVMTIYATQLFIVGKDGAGSLGIFYTAFGLGAILGPLGLNLLNNGSVRTMRRLIIVAYVVISVGWFLFGSAPTLLLASAALLIKAMGSSIYWTYSSVILQKTVPDEFLGRLFALDIANFQLSAVAGVIVTGWVVQQVGTAGVRNVVFGTGAISLIPLILWAVAIPWIERQDVTLPQVSQAAE